MTCFEMFLLAIALSIDACVVSFSYGLVIKQKKLLNALLLASFTGMFQGIMPCIGYFLTNFIKRFISSYADWIVFVIFVFLGFKFIKEASQEKKNVPVCVSLICLFLVGLATSIDAFSAGISLALYGNDIFKSALLITVVTFVNSCLGFMLGIKFKLMKSIYVEYLAGLVLIFLGIKALF